MSINKIAEDLLKSEGHRDDMTDREKTRRQKANHVIGVLGNLRGQMHEEKALRACDNKKYWPSYVIAIREALKIEDEKEQTDMVVITSDVGRIRVQIKSSQAEADKFFGNGYLRDYWYLKDHIAMVVVNKDETLKTTAQKIFREVGRIRQIRLADDKRRSGLG